MLFLQAISNGLDAVRKIARDKHLSGVYGPLIDNFTCDSKVFTAVEVTAGNRSVTKCGATSAFLSD